MADFFNSAEKAPPSCKRRLAQLFLLLFLATSSALFIEHWRGERALEAWMSEMKGRGEIFNPKILWPASNPASFQFSNELAEAVEQLPKSLNQFGGGVAGLSLDEAGRPVRGSKQARPLALGYQQDKDSTWQKLQIASEAAQPALEKIRKLLKNPPRSMDGDIATRLEADAMLNLWHIRRSGRALHIAIINDLHRGDLQAALENLEALQDCARLYADEPALLNYMLRVAQLGLGSDACWDALQEDGWTEPQLVRLQKSCQSNALFLQMPEVLAAERVARLHSMDWFGSHSYQAWMDRFADLLKGFGCKPPELNTASWTGQWRRWIFHPAWSYAWRAQDELDYLRYSQQDLAIVREAVARGAWVHLKERQTTLRNSYRRPPADWRFYRPLPLQGELGEIIGTSRSELPECPYPSFSKPWLTAAKHLTRHEMVITAIALKRYRLQTGKMPKDLGALVPEYLAALPHDFMDGQPLRYRLNADGSFVLYSVGEDAQDDGGNWRPQRQDGWSGRDWVWPVTGSQEGPDRISG